MKSCATASKNTPGSGSDSRRRNVNIDGKMSVFLFMHTDRFVFSRSGFSSVTRFNDERWNLPITAASSPKWRLLTVCCVWPIVQNQKIVHPQIYETVNSRIQEARAHKCLAFLCNKQLKSCTAPVLVELFFGLCGSWGTLSSLRKHHS